MPPRARLKDVISGVCNGRLLFFKRKWKMCEWCIKMRILTVLVNVVPMAPFKDWPLHPCCRSVSFLFLKLRSIVN